MSLPTEDGFYWLRSEEWGTGIAKVDGFDPDYGIEPRFEMFSWMECSWEPVANANGEWVKIETPVGWDIS